MATFKAIVRRKRADGLYPVYIRVVHRRMMGYIPTGKVVSQNKLTRMVKLKILLLMNIVQEKFYDITT